MNEKHYRKLSEHLSLEQNLEERKNVVAAFHRVKKGERFSFSDLEIVQKELLNQQGDKQTKVFNMRKAIQNVEGDIASITENVSNKKKRFKKMNHDLNRLKRQRRLQLERDRRAEIEREMN